MSISKAPVLFFFVLLLLVPSIFAERGDYSQVRVIIDTKEDIEKLRTYSAEYVVHTPEYVEVIVNHAELDKLLGAGFKIEYVHEDLEEFYRSRVTKTDRYGYFTLSQVYSEMGFYRFAFPNLISDSVNIGTTIEGRSMYAWKVSDNPDVDEDEPEILFTGAIHSREMITPLILLAIVDTLIMQYGSDPYITELVDEHEIWVIPVVNADGYAYNYDGFSEGGMWRKNRRDNGDGTFGVDLNRNYGYMWGYDDIGSSPETDDQSYRGTGPFSEPETQNMRDFITDHEFIITCYYHSYSNLILWPFGYEAGIYSPDENIFRTIGDTLASFNSYYPTVSWGLYPTNGDSDDWGYGEQTTKNKNFAFTFEVGTYIDGFWPEAGRIQPLISENLMPALSMIDIIDSVNQVLPPNVPALTAPDSVDIMTPFQINWEHVDADNAAQNFEVVEMSGFDVITEDCADMSGWVNDGFEIVSSPNYTSPNSFYSGQYDLVGLRHIGTFAPYTVQPNDTLKFMISYDISEVWDFAYVEVSTDGKYFTSIPGNITTEADYWYHNHGHGITGSSNGDWVEARFDLSDYVGEDIYIRFTYQVHDSYYAWWGFYIDDISPIPEYAFAGTLNSAVTDTFFNVSGKPEDKYYYKVRAQDGDGQWGFYSDIRQVVIGNPIEYICGDANGDLGVNLLDITYIIGYLYSEGPAPEPLEAADANGDSVINLLDLTYLINYLYREGPDPVC